MDFHVFDLPCFNFRCFVLNLWVHSNFLLGRDRVSPFVDTWFFDGPLAYEARWGALSLTMTILVVRSMSWSSTSLFLGLAFSFSAFKSIISPIFWRVGSIIFSSITCRCLVPTYLLGLIDTKIKQSFDCIIGRGKVLNSLFIDHVFVKHITNI